MKRRFLAAAREVVAGIAPPGIAATLHARLMGTGENAVVRIGPFVVRIARDASRFEEAREEVALLRAMMEAGLPVPWPLLFPKRANPSVRSFSGLSSERTVTVFLYDSGRTLDSPSTREAAEAGTLLRRLHETGRGFVVAPRRVPDALDLSGRLDDEGAGARIEALLGENKAFTQAVREYRRWSDGRPRGLSHGDYHPGNLLRTRGGELRALDFDGFGLAPGLYDVASFTREVPGERGVFLDAYGLGAEDRRDLGIVERYRTAQKVFWITQLRGEPAFAGWWERWCRGALAELGGGHREFSLNRSSVTL